MARRDLASILDAKNGNDPVVSVNHSEKTTAVTNGTSKDLLGASKEDYRSAAMLVLVKNWTDSTTTIKLQESTDNNTFTDVAAANLVWDTANTSFNASGQVVINACADDNQAYLVGYVGTARYIRAGSAVTSATSGVEWAAIILSGHPRYHAQDLMK